MNNKEIIQEIKKQTGIKDFRDGMLAAHFLCRPISRPCSVWFIKHNVKPNQVTLLMILFGIIGSVLFAIPNVWIKIAGYIFWILWFTMDLSDGQVARYTKTFSKYGTEMDYMAHLIDHPCMNIAILLTFLQMNIINPLVLCLIFIVCISIELIIRNVTAFDYFHKKLYANTNNIEQTKPSYLKYFIVESTLYPTMIICFSWIIIVGYAFDLEFVLYLYILWLIAYVILSLKAIIKHFFKYYKSAS